VRIRRSYERLASLRVMGIDLWRRLGVTAAAIAATEDQVAATWITLRERGRMTPPGCGPERRGPGSSPPRNAIGRPRTTKTRPAPTDKYA
jgi:hypothetical protein